MDLTFVGSLANAHYFPSYWNVMTYNTTLQCYILWVGIHCPPTILSPMILVLAFSYIVWPTIYTMNYVIYKRFLHMEKHVFSICGNCAQIYKKIRYPLIQFETKIMEFYNNSYNKSIIMHLIIWLFVNLVETIRISSKVVSNGSTQIIGDHIVVA